MRGENVEEDIVIIPSNARDGIGMTANRSTKPPQAARLEQWPRVVIDVVRARQAPVVPCHQCVLFGQSQELVISPRKLHNASSPKW